MIKELKAGVGNALNPRTRRFVHLGVQLATDPFRKHFRCPVCGYRGPFMDANFHIDVYGSAHEDAICPGCSSYERHRFQRLVFEELANRMDFSTKSLLHIAPETCNESYFRRSFGRYATGDLYMSNVDIRLDLTRLQIEDAQYDVVLATHVLEHIQDDIAAISEIRRIIKPGGFAILPVPIVASVTTEYGYANGQEFGHVRACGPDYFDRYRAVFSIVKVYQSTDFAEQFQLYFKNDRTGWPSDSCPMLKPAEGTRHLDYVPVCFV